MSTLTLSLLLVACLGLVIFVKPLVQDPFHSASALCRFYRLSAAHRQSEVLQSVARAWWSMVLVPVYVLIALVLVGYLGSHS